VITLFLIRHAHAGDPEHWTGDDGLRPLTDKGRRQAERVGNLLSAADEAPDLVVTSPLARAEETARIVAGALDVPLVVDRRLVGPLYAEVVQDILAAAGPSDRPCIVGHDPDFSSLLGELIGVAVVPMRKGSVARVDFEGHVRSGRGTLRFLVPPEVLSGR
jgi:phosphohistidine phosphatase SixA